MAWRRSMQARLGVTVDGVVGRNTYTALFRHTGAAIGPASELALSANVNFPRFGIDDTALRLCHFLAQLGHESGSFRSMEEGLIYTTAARICAVWPSRFPTLASAQHLVRNPEGLANQVYANRLGNGPPESGDGYRYRGRGLIQLTGRDNYRRYGHIVGLGLEQQPDLAAIPSVGLLIACTYWQDRNINPMADRDDLIAVTRAVNGGLNGIADRRQRLMAMKALVA